MSKHTPGPWEWDGNTLRPTHRNPEQSDVYSILDADGGYGFLDSDYRDTFRELESDRALISAAPDLLDALLEMVNEAQPLGIDRTAYQKALAAIAKATGEP